MHTVDANLVTVQWGLIGVFGVVVGLLIAPADKFLQDFLASGQPRDQKRASGWATSLKGTAVLVLLALFGLSLVGAIEAGLGPGGPFTTAYWLLLTPVLAQAGFVILVLRLVKRVPGIVTLPMDRPPVCRASPTAQSAPTVIRFVNQTAIEIHVWWLDFDGNKDDRGPVLAAGSEATQSTYSGHRFLLSMTPDLGICTVEAASDPASVIIQPEHLLNPSNLS